MFATQADPIRGSRAALGAPTFATRPTPQDWLVARHDAFAQPGRELEGGFLKAPFPLGCCKHLIRQVELISNIVDTIDIEEDDEAMGRGPLVAIQKRLVLGNANRKHTCLLNKIRSTVERRRLGTLDRRRK